MVMCMEASKNRSMGMCKAAGCEVVLCYLNFDASHAYEANKTGTLASSPGMLPEILQFILADRF